MRSLPIIFVFAFLCGASLRSTAQVAANSPPAQISQADLPGDPDYLPIVEQEKPAAPVLSRSFIVSHSVLFASTFANVESDRYVRRVNRPLWNGKSRLQEYTTDLGVVGGLTVMDYYLKKRYPHGLIWFIAPFFVTAVQLGNAVTNLRTPSPVSSASTSAIVRRSH